MGEALTERHELAARRPNGFASILVSDTGVGVAPEHLDRVFDRFCRVPGVAGLGLAIVKRIAELHGGRVAVQARVGEGARLSVELPAAPSTALVN
jgi:two-component system phosphate regulon sensor histidine kinase PhoR